MEADRSELEQMFSEMEDDRLLETARQNVLTHSARDVLTSELRRRLLPIPEPSLLPEVEAGLGSAIAWVTVVTLRDVSAAIVARGALESAGIPCYLRDENTVRLDWQISNFIGGLRLQVPEEEQEMALQVLTHVEEIDDGFGFSAKEDQCPACGSLAIQRQARGRGLALLALHLFSFPVPQGKAVWRCERCHARWTDEDRENYSRATSM